jgi:hypothetical protein
MLGVAQGGGEGYDRPEVTFAGGRGYQYSHDVL